MVRGAASMVLLLLCGFWFLTCGDSPAEPGGDGQSTPVSLDIANQDGEIAGNAFDSAKDGFEVGEGTGALADDLVYEISVTNQLATPVHDLMVLDQVAPHSGTLACSGVREQEPTGAANPSTGIVVGSDCTSAGFVWEIGTLGGGETASLYFHAEALEEGDDVNRVTVTAEGLSSALVIEEPTLVGPGVSLELSVADGHVQSNVFTSAVDPHFVGAGSAGDPDGLIYEVAVINQSAATATNVEVAALVPGGLGCQGVRPTAPDGGPNPSIGLATCTIQGFGWLLENLDPGEAGVLYLRLEALSSGNHVTRVTLSADVLTRDVRRDELTTVLPAP